MHFRIVHPLGVPLTVLLRPNRHVTVRKHRPRHVHSGSTTVLGHAEDWPHPVVSSDPLTHRKSVFQAHATPFSLSPTPSCYETTVQGCAQTSRHDTKGQLETLFAHILRLHPRTKRATHRMWAYRCRTGPMLSAINQLNTKERTTNPPVASSSPSAAKHALVSYSDVEPASGAILERLLELNHHSDVVVVVYRWYGGVKMGGERWRCISSAAAEALSKLSMEVKPQQRQSKK